MLTCALAPGVTVGKAIGRCDLDPRLTLGSAARSSRFAGSPLTTELDRPGRDVGVGIGRLTKRKASVSLPRTGVATLGPGIRACRRGRSAILSDSCRWTQSAAAPQTSCSGMDRKTAQERHHSTTTGETLAEWWFVTRDDTRDLRPLWRDGRRPVRDYRPRRRRKLLCPTRESYQTCAACRIAAALAA